ncbi:carboxy terminal-processing peptidase [Blattabacterium cuenoti]|uniref:carboxy terminal-processing peptidase n=1 Tax=Blattabacterium cuenoti TaxID=1653831 RepID=UPI00163D2538|nr:carboxy terminal-processing peptidase [Blattabacterium cuenoti]
MENSKIIKIKWIIIGVFILFLFSFCSSSNEEEHGKNIIILKKIYKTLCLSHINPINVNNDFSETVYKKYFEQLDSKKRFFLQKDINSLSLYKDKIDDFWIHADTTFFDIIIQCFYQRIKEVESICLDILKNPFDFNKKEIYSREVDSSYPNNDRECIDKWRKYLKYLTLLEITNSIKQKEKISNRKIWKNLFFNAEKESRKKIKEYVEEYFRKLKMIKKSDWFSIYVNTIISQYDPHTNYFSPKEKEIFNLSVSGQTEGIGIELKDEKGYAIVVNIVIGSPAWKSKKIDVGDKIIKVSKDLNSEENIVGMLLENSIRLIKGKKGTKVKLTIQKKNGSIEEVILTRDIVEKKEIFAKSALILDNKKYKYGLIFLPEFYFNPENKNGRNATDDIKKIIQELKKENIKGIILDLRNNRGGSLSSVIDIAGFFLGKVPIVQIGKSPNIKKILKNNNHKILWEGPLVVIVNEQSASASEILSAAIKDYKRGIIIGSEQTYGKGTVQTIYPLNRFCFFYKKKELGILKFTMNKFYRINGGSTQLKGVNSDIIIPSNGSSKLMEKYHQNSMKWDQVAPVSIKTWDEKKLEKIKIKSINRLRKNNKLINKIYKNMQLLENKSLNKKTYSLNWRDSYYENLIIKKSKKYFQKLKKYLNNVYGKFPINYKIIVNKNELEKKWIKNLNKDFYISEYVNILRDFNEIP